MEEVENLVLFPLESGRFKTSQLTTGCTYEVHGTQMQDSAMANQQSGVGTPYGAYTNPTYQPSPPLPHPPRSSKSSRVIKKTIMVVTFPQKSKGKAKCSTRMEYTVVTQVVVSLTPSQCSVEAVTELVTQQLGFQAVLLDSKCFPLIGNEGTSGDFWKGTRKILAASKSHYEKSTGQSADIMSIGEAIEITDEEPGPSTKRRCTEGVEINPIMQEVTTKLTMIDKKLGFLNELGQGFQCIICKSLAILPVVSSCCQRVIGCEACVNHWMTLNDRCPLCSTQGGDIANRFTLKGFDDTLSLLHITSKDRTDEGLPPPESDSDEDFQ